MGDPAHTLVNKHASHVWSKVSFDLDMLWINKCFLLDHGTHVDGARASDFRFVCDLPFLSPFVFLNPFCDAQRQQIAPGEMGHAGVPRDRIPCRTTRI